MSKIPQSLAELVARKKAELFDQQKPVYIPKELRGKGQQIATKTQVPVLAKPVVKEESKVYEPYAVRSKRQFQFEWDDCEDTTEHIDVVPVRKRQDILEKYVSVHYTQKSYAELNQRDARLIRSDYKIAAVGQQISVPILNWSDLQLPDRFIDILYRMYPTPTSIQRQALPCALNNRDVLGVSSTGSGKTLAFVVPMIDRIMKSGIQNVPQALVLVPTRELAQQINEELYKFKFFGVTSLVVIGGKDIEKQSIYMNQQDILICTPGRMRDCLERRYLDLERISCLVLDEFDRMIDLGFSEDVNFIIEQVPSTRQTLMFSATQSIQILALAKTYMKNAVQITVGTLGQASIKIKQLVEFCAQKQKGKQLLTLLERNKFGYPILVFCNIKATCDKVYSIIKEKNYRVAIIHSGKSQDLRERAIRDIKQGQVDILVCTSVAARGIDIPNVALVLNYDMASTIQDYIHRCGRTGRAGNDGVCLSFLTEEDQPIFYDLKVLLEKSGQKVPQQLSSITGNEFTF